MSVRLARIGDAETIVAGNLGLAKETEGKELRLETVRRGVRRLLEEPGLGFYLVAEHDGRVVGQLCVTFEWSDWRDGLFFWIQSVWVDADWRREGVYRQLHRRVTELARERGDVAGLRLYVMDDNGDARATYEAVSMKETPYRVYEALLSGEEE